MAAAAVSLLVSRQHSLRPVAAAAAGELCWGLRVRQGGQCRPRPFQPHGAGAGPSRAPRHPPAQLHACAPAPARPEASRRSRRLHSKRLCRSAPACAPSHPSRLRPRSSPRLRPCSRPERAPAAGPLRGDRARRPSGAGPQPQRGEAAQWPHSALPLPAAPPPPAAAILQRETRDTLGAGARGSQPIAEHVQRSTRRAGERAECGIAERIDGGEGSSVAQI